jgi:hypothetical protein
MKLKPMKNVDTNIIKNKKNVIIEELKLNFR